jgi:hypothetical protein
MFHLPKSNPLILNLATDALKLPEVVSKLSTDAFTGYVSFDFQPTAIWLVFESGKLVSVLLEDGKDTRQTGFEALFALTHLMVNSSGGTVNAYKLSRDLTMGIHALLQGEILYKAQEIKHINIKAVLGKIKSDQINGCLRIYTDDRSTMIFYKEGAPIGFFHDISQDIENSPNEAQKIAGLPGAKIDLYSTQEVEQLMDQDLLEIVNIQTIWDTAVGSRQPEINKNSNGSEERDNVNSTAKLAQLEEQIKLIVTKYAGKLGRGIVDKELILLGGNACLLDETNVVKFIAAVERSAKLLISSSSIKLMLDELSKSITSARSGS